MRDRLSANGNHELKLLFHFAPKTTLNEIAEGDKTKCVDAALPADKLRGGAGLQLAVFGLEGPWSREESWISQCYGHRKAAPVCSFSTDFSGNRDLANQTITMMLPSHAEKPKFEVKEVEAIGGRAFEIGGRDYCDLIVLKDSGSAHVETVRLVSDFDWAWARFGHNNVAGDLDLLELLVIDGQRLELDGKEIVKSGKRIKYLAASRVGDRFRVETNEGLLDLSFPIGDLASLFEESNRLSALGN
jgi:hypothetical protein